jgi:hypothetical protein
MRQLVQGRALGCCERCLEWAPDAHHHHRRVRGMGGSKATNRHDPSNLVQLCPVCHKWVHDNPAESVATGFMVPRNSPLSPFDVPVVDLAGVSRLLDDEGSFEVVEHA